jgi:hypothetical protein
MTRKPRANFDQPVVHVPEESVHFVPPKARSAAEIARRKKMPKLPPGKSQLIAEYQKRGVDFSAGIFEKVGDEASIKYAAGTLAVVAWNASWYTNARRATDVMRRRQLLPKIADDETGARLTEVELSGRIGNSFMTLSMQAEGIVAERARGQVVSSHDWKFGQKAGNTALELSALHHNITGIGGNAVEIQDQMMAAAMLTAEEARNLGLVIGAVPSFAQFADPDSALSVNWRRNAPNGALEAYHATVEEIGFAPL